MSDQDKASQRAAAYEASCHAFTLWTVQGSLFCLQPPESILHRLLLCREPVQPELQAWRAAHAQKATHVPAQLRHPVHVHPCP